MCVCVWSMRGALILEEIGRASQFQMDTRTEAVTSVKAVVSQGERARVALTNSRAGEAVVNT